MIRAVTFDLWNTLISDKDYTEQRVKCLADILSRLDISRSYDEIREAYKASHIYAHKVWREENYRYVTAHERLGHILKRLSADLKEDLKMEILQRFERIVLIDPPSLVRSVRETLEFLSTNYIMGIISDTGMTPGRVLRKVLEGHQILKFFHVTVFSDNVGYSKPHKTMFMTALQGLGVKPSEAVHVGDLLHTDIAGAKATGMKTVWLNKKREVKVGQYQPEYEIRCFSEIINVLKSIC